MTVWPHRASQKSVRLLYLCDGAAGVNHDEWHKKQRPSPKPRDADKPRNDVLSWRMAHKVTTSLQAETPRRCRSSAWTICVRPWPTTSGAGAATYRPLASASGRKAS